MTTRSSAVRGIRSAWLVAMIAVLIFWVVAAIHDFSTAPQATEDGELHLLSVLVLVALTFPMGVVWAGLLNVGTYVLDTLHYHAEISDGLLIPFVWLGFVAVGYVQWFKLLPWLWYKWKEKRT